MSFILFNISIYFSLIKDDTPLVSASQYFMDNKSPKRNRTTSDNEFFDHLVAGDTAMMCDENVGEAVSNDILNIPAPEPNMKHCNSAAKLNVSDSFDDDKQRFVDEKAGNNDSVTQNEAYGDVFINNSTTKNESSEETVTDHAQSNPDTDHEPSSDANEVKSAAEDKEDIPVFRLFANDTNAASDTTKSELDDFSDLVDNGDNVVQPDAFSAAIEESELNRRRDAWIPSSATNEYFKNHADSPTDSRKSFTNPQLILKIMLVSSFLLSTIPCMVFQHPFEGQFKN